MTPLRLGFIPLSDCAVLAVAQEKGMFGHHGLEVVLSREVSWANVRDKLAVGALDGAQMLAGMPLAAALGIDPVGGPMVTAFSLGLNGNAITVATPLWQRMAATGLANGEALRRIVEENQRQGLPRLRFAVVYPFASHNYELRYWLAAHGIEPDDDVDLSVVAPPRMVDALAGGSIDGFCVGEPWSSLAVERGLGHIAATKYEIWNNSPEKVLAVRQSFAENEPSIHRALLRALLEAALWCDADGNRRELARILAQPEYVGAPETVLARPLCGRLALGAAEDTVPMPDFHVFHRYAANFPWTSHAVWLLTQMLRWGQITSPIDVLAMARRVYQPDLHREAARDLGLVVPSIDLKSEGTHEHEWWMETEDGPLQLGRDLFCDGQEFHPRRALAYLARSEARIPASVLEGLAALNP